MNEKYTNPAYILLLFRDGVASDWESLCEAVGIPLGARSAGYILARHLRALKEAGLLIFEHDSSYYELGSISLSDTWPRIQTALHISLSELASVGPHQSMFVAPYFGRPKEWNKDDQIDLFVLMPFSDELKPVYEDHIKNVAEFLNINVKRADDFFTADAVMQNIWSAIYASHLIIADCTGRNPNVFYEIGLAHAIGKPVILIAQNDEDVPFDLRHIRYIQYKLTPRGMKKFEDSLTETVKYEMRHKAKN